MSLIRLKLGAGEAKSGSYLAPILGQHQIPIMEFIKTFNNISLNEFTAGTLIGVNLIKQQGLPLKYKLKGFSVLLLLKCFLNINKSNYITITQLFDLFNISFNKFKLLENNLSINVYTKKSYFLSVLGAMSSLNKKVSIKF